MYNVHHIISLSRRRPAGTLSELKWTIFPIQWNRLFRPIGKKWKYFTLCKEKEFTQDLCVIKKG